MRLAFRIGVFAAFLFMFAGVVSAESPYRVEVFGSVGAAEKFELFGGPSPTRLNIGGGFGVRPFSPNRSRLLRMLGGEFEVNTTPLSTGGVQYFTGNLLLHASVGVVEPYLLFGAGAAHAGSTHRAADVGIGAKVFLTPQVSVRPEFRALLAQYVGDYSRGSVAIGYHW